MSNDKEWTQKYAFEPNSNVDKSTPSPTPPPSYQAQAPAPSFRNHTTTTTTNTKKPALGDISARRSNPSASSSPSSNFHPSNPWSPKSPTPRIEVSRSPPTSSARSSPRSPLSRTAPGFHHESNRPRSSSAHGPQPHPKGSSPPGAARHQRRASNSNLPPRFAGDMSHRPLDTIRRENRVANRSSKHRRGPSQTDPIDALDTIGGGYHHDGPYEATLASRNVNPKYAPVNAVRQSNMEAIRATPREYVEDSLNHHVPLQGTSIIPNGSADFSGNVMNYREGADLMREQDAPGGAYKRWDGIRYHPEDLKGKGEPSYTYERDQKAKEAQRLLHPDYQHDNYEMQPSRRMRSSSHGANDSAGTASGLAPPGQDDGIQRSNTTGRRLSDGLKRRFGSLRKKQDMPAENVS